MSILAEIGAVIDEIRPTLQAEGGEIEIVSFDEATGVLNVRLQGLCSSCPMSAITLRTGIERVVTKRVPAVIEVRGQR